MFRLEVKMGRKWKLGWNVYSTLQEAEERAKVMTSVGHKVRIVKA
jgi:hypothetical protein